MIAVSFALPAESSEFICRLQRRSRVGGISSGLLHEHEVVVFHTGVGEKATRAALAAFLERHQPSAVISAGFAGALTPALELGDLLIAENFSAPGLVTAALAAFSRRDIRVANLTSALEMLDSSADRQMLAQATGAIAVDMETEAIAAVCATRGIPLLSLRVISDTPAAPFPAPPNVLFDLEKQRTNYLALIRYLVTHPSRMSKVVAFAKQIARARSSLTAALDLVLRSERF